MVWFSVAGRVWDWEWLLGGVLDDMVMLFAMNWYYFGCWESMGAPLVGVPVVWGGWILLWNGLCGAGDLVDGIMWPGIVLVCDL